MKVFLYFRLAALLLAGVSSLHAVEIIAHRGASFDAPENTVASFKLGWEQNADADELDIYLSQDDQIVVLHDKNTKRTTGVNKAVVQQTLAELRAQDAGSWKDPRWTGEKLPTLAEALATMPDGKRFFIEIKCGPEILPELEHVLKASGKKAEQLVIIGFDYETMRQARIQFPDLAVYWLASYSANKSTGELPILDDLLLKTKAAKLTGLNLDFHFPIDGNFVNKVKADGLKLYTWTVDDPVVAKTLAAAGVDGITTNRPAWLRQQLK
ncbi:MAG: ugpQ 3 [Chthoniobacteraceae bacterium]|nr:ugpQ 3 [Chthoniobacteraceae bacterium]